MLLAGYHRLQIRVAVDVSFMACGFNLPIFSLCCWICFTLFFFYSCLLIHFLDHSIPCARLRISVDHAWLFNKRFAVFRWCNLDLMVVTRGRALVPKMVYQ